MLKIEVKTDGAAFTNPDTGEEDSFWEGVELSRILAKIQFDIEDGCTFGVILDINGNKVGTWSR